MATTTKEAQIKELRAQILAGTHSQFIFNAEKNEVQCRCGKNAVWWKTGYLCASITAYPCKY